MSSPWKVGLIRGSHTPPWQESQLAELWLPAHNTLLAVAPALLQGQRAFMPHR